MLTAKKKSYLKPLRTFAGLFDHPVSLKYFWKDLKSIHVHVPIMNL